MLDFFNENFGRYLTPQTGNPAGDAQRALSSPLGDPPALPGWQ